MAHNPQQSNTNSSNYMYNTFQPNNQYNVYSSTINSNIPPAPGVSPSAILPSGISNYSNQISPPGTTPPGIINYSNQISPPGITPPGISNYSNQISPPGTTPLSTNQQNYQYYYPYQQYYYSQEAYSNYNIHSTSQQSAYNTQSQNTYKAQTQSYIAQPPPPAYPPNTIPEPPSKIQDKANTSSSEKSYSQITYKINNSSNSNNGSYTNGSNTFRPNYIPVQIEKPKDNNLETNTNKEEMAKTPKEKKGTEYPQSLKHYITKMYKICPKDKRDVLEVELKKLISDAQIRNSLHTIKWENMGLPAKCLENQKPVESEGISNNLLINKKRKRIMDTSSSSSSLSSMVMDDSLKNLPEDERLEEVRRRERRAKRFNDDYNAEMKKKQEKEILKRQAEKTKQMYIDQNGNPDVVDWDQDTLVGTCQDLEKNYLRLTSAPDPSTVRPLPVLRKTLDLLKRKWSDEQNYNYICDQLKSLRQDLTVQRIKNEFAVEVYETHARIALEKGDLGEYNQCQSQLKQLYKLGFKGHENEFLAYRILYYVYTLNPKDMNTLISKLSPLEKKDPFIKHALDVRSAVANGNYHKLFKLYVDTPENMAAYLMDHFVERERIKALKVMTKAYFSLSIPFITDELEFESDDECKQFLKSVRCPIEEDKNKEYIIKGKAAHPIFNKKWQEITKKGIDIKGQI